MAQMFPTLGSYQRLKASGAWVRNVRVAQAGGEEMIGMEPWHKSLHSLTISSIRSYYHTPTPPPPRTSLLRPASNVHHLSAEDLLCIEAHNMATLGRSGDASYGYFLRPGSRSSNHVSTKSSPVETSPPKGYEDAPIYQFTGIPDLRKRV
jgi:hypothetical protein